MLDTSKVYASKKYGSFRVVNYINYRNVSIEFIDTGYIVTVQASDIIKGNVKDRFLPSVYGFGYIGSGGYKSKENGKITKQYQVWRGMIGRCYDAKTQIKNPTYKDCTVCDEWLNFQVFAKWFDANYIKNHQLDKDIKVSGNRVYSPETCLFVSLKENNIEAHAKSYSFKSPEGKVFNVYNLAEFCRDNHLSESTMSAVSLGKRNQHKGWINHG